VTLKHGWIEESATESRSGLLEGGFEKELVTQGRQKWLEEAGQRIGDTSRSELLEERVKE